ncbi:MAG: XdhC/CoxI family protein [Polyangiaceae bacterium]
MPKPIPLRPPVAVEPSSAAARVPSPATPSELLAVAAERLARGVFVAVATVLARRGSAPSTPGQKVLLSADGACLGTVGGGAIEREVLEALDRMVNEAAGGGARPVHEVRTFKLGAELGMCCGGSVDVLLEPMVARVPCLVVGAGHVAAATAPLLARLGFAVTICDEREETPGRPREPRRRDHVLGHLGRGRPRGAQRRRRARHDPRSRARSTRHRVALREGFAFVGVGSRAKAARTRDRLAAKGFADADLARVRMPIGLEIGARLPEEIAVSIAAELVQWKQRRA